MAQNAQLVMAKGPRPEEAFPLDAPPLVLGRDPRNSIVIDHPQVSRRHARLIQRGDTWIIEDLDSTNGTFVNDRRLVGPHPLTTGDIVGLGEAVLLTFQEGEPTSDASPEETVTPPASRPTPPRDHQAPARRPTSFDPMESASPYPSVGPQTGPEGRPGRDRMWIWLAVGVVILLLIAACAIVLILAYLGVLPGLLGEVLGGLGLT